MFVIKKLRKIFDATGNILFILICSSFLLHASISNYSPLIVTVIMVKNEESVIEATLRPFIEGGIDAFFVFDTGSIDDTVAIAQQFFINHNVCGYVEQEPFIDFATSRNRALERAQLLFPHAAFMIMCDAEWYLSDAKALREFCKRCLECGDRYATYLIRVVNETLDIYSPRLIRCKSNACFEGAVHETIVSQTRVKVPESIYFEYKPCDDGIEKTKRRYVRDRELLYQHYLCDPTNPRTLFYLALTCEGLNNNEEAYGFYKQRIVLTGLDEEDFMAYYRLACVIDQLCAECKDYTWSEALLYYLCAYAMRPHRVEPLVRIAQHYCTINPFMALLFAQHAATMPYPADDILVMEKHMYTSVRYQVLQKIKERPQ